jgi:hypothetical protein
MEKKPRRRRLLKPPPEPAVHVIETFLKPFYDVDRLARHDTPSCFNQTVAIQKYRVTVERIEEPVEVYHERLKKLWHESDNHHNGDALKAAADKLGLELSYHDFGKASRSGGHG